MYNFLLSFHGLLALLLLIALPLTLLLSFLRHHATKPLSLVVTVMAHLQLLLGLYLYFGGSNGMQLFETGEAMSNSAFRFYAVEHITTMILAIVLLTVARSKVKNTWKEQSSSRAPFYWYLAGFVLLLSRVPWDRWPFIGN